MKNSPKIKILHLMRYLYSKRETIYDEFNKINQLELLLNKDRITTVFQPILSLKEGSTVGVEVLNRPDSTPLFPTTEKFYDYVTKSDQILRIERFLQNLSFERFSDQANKAQSHKDKLVFLNVQPHVLADPAFRGHITEELTKHNLFPYQIVLELTEKEAIFNYNQFEKMIEYYRLQGFRIAVDDAGTGYNSLKALISLKPEFLKIDKSLIRNIEEHPEKQHLVEVLLDFAIQSNSEVIAEGIETLSELKYLTNLGIHMGQGYALGKPKPELSNGHLPFLNSVNRHQLAL